MTTTDQPLSIDDILNEPLQGRGWVAGPAIHVDQSRRECNVADRTGDSVLVSYRPEDEANVLKSLEHPDQWHLKALGLAEYQPGSVMTRVTEIERLSLISREQAEHPTVKDLWDELDALITASEWAKLPPDLAENHDKYLAREHHNDDTIFDD